MLVAIAPDENFVGCDFQESEIVAVIVAEIPFIFIIKVIGECVYRLMSSHMGFSFNKDGETGVGQR